MEALHRDLLQYLYLKESGEKYIPIVDLSDAMRKEISELRPALEDLLEKGLIVANDDVFHISRLGMDYALSLWA